jgi:aerobic-type carbon monoxide dehydrogenase small subunit (CoxS/CutS family)
MEEQIRFRLNAKSVSMTIERERMLLWVLRTEFGLTGSKYGCGIGLCGACTVLVNNRAAQACQIPMKNIRGKEIITIEGFAANGKLHPLQEAFAKHNAFQCGYCTSGMILSAYDFLQRNPRPSYNDVLKAMENNLCRCGSYNRIVKAILTAAQEMGG